MFIHTLIKIKYSEEGYLPDHPYHLISDDEMFEAFIGEGGYFEENYPCLSDSLINEYIALKDAILYHINKYRIDDIVLPDWVYSYMLGNVISCNSNESDITDMRTLCGINDTSLEFDSELSEMCYQISAKWIVKLKDMDNRPATMFGEPHVLKSLRLSQSDVTGG